MHNELRESLNFHTIYSLLNSYRLILPSEDHYVISNPKISTETKIDMVISWLPKAGNSDYLTPFISCLRESGKGDSGVAHTELADEMEKQRDEEWKKYKYGTMIMIIEPLQHFIIILSFIHCPVNCHCLVGTLCSRT